MPSYRIKAVVLKKTKLREKDLILTLLAEDGQQLRAVAKGAQKPGSTFAARLEVFSVVDLMLYEGKSLDTVTDVRSIEPNEACRIDVMRLSYGAVMAELLEKTALEGQEMPVTFPLAVTALESLGRVSEDKLPLVVAAFLVKLVAYLGYRPSFDVCVMCGASRGDGRMADGRVAVGHAAGHADGRTGTSHGSTAHAVDGRTSANHADSHAAGHAAAPSCHAAAPDAGNDATTDAGAFSISSGGWVCGDCSAGIDGHYGDDYLDPSVVAWVKALLSMRFSEIEAIDASAADALAGGLLDFCEKWIYIHLGLRLKSMGFLSRLQM